MIPRDAEYDITTLAVQTNTSVANAKHKLKLFREKHASIGLRGCRIYSMYPELLVMQAKAITAAALHLAKNSSDFKVYPRITIPFVSSDREIELLIPIIRSSIKEEFRRQGESYHDSSLIFTIGASLSTPRACIRSGPIAQLVSYLSYDLVDLTELTYGCNEESTAVFMPMYLRDKMFEANPFKQIDLRGVGTLLEKSIEAARHANANLLISTLSDKHSIDAFSVRLFHKMGIDSICCKPKNIVLSKLIAAQVAIRYPTKSGDVVPGMIGKIGEDSWLDS